jgi:hypothetical protein
MNDLFRFLMLRARKGKADNLAFSDEAKRLAGREPDVSLARVGALMRGSQRFVASAEIWTKSGGVTCLSCSDGHFRPLRTTKGSSVLLNVRNIPFLRCPVLARKALDLRVSGD